ncbi:transferase 2, rSAM/selenodomain-associated [Anaerohalosphaera lusitana]|uniref:Transferase 2, rSAM/selenodomain-associated n=1 Tax=Anaerohalosphaera lusitana TaxID=1936003 RepID=A0A1U9NJE5_9BACT|nr:glycosyltransferase family A protein [Anaerohalosphaera lusitana]AQT67945.1 transferase 2, rSAM/selenodomain-associated [Anaerohalosphaera lusitana]
MDNITFAIPTYNNAETIMTVLKRCLQQDVKPKILIMDNGSTDGTVEMLRAAINNGIFGPVDIKLESVQRMLGGKSKNIPYVRYKLCQAVDTEYVFLLDADVLIPQHAILGLREMLEEDGDLVGAGIRVDPIVEHIQFGAILLKSEIARQIKWNNGEGKCECLWALQSINQLDDNYKVKRHPVYQAMHLKGF